MSTSMDGDIAEKEDTILTVDESSLDMIAHVEKTCTKIEDHGRAADASHHYDGVDTTAVITAEGKHLGPSARQLPRTPSAFDTFPFDTQNPKKRASAIISKLVVKLGYPDRELDNREHGIVDNILEALSHLTTYTAAVDKWLLVKWTLESVMGRSPKARRPYAFPQYLQYHAEIVLRNVDNDLASEEAAKKAARSSSGLQVNRPERREARSRASVVQRRARRMAAEINGPTARGLMRGITYTMGDKRHVYKIADLSTIVDANVAGHNGLQIGQWWPLRHCALRDGAHGSTMSGIAGSKHKGAFSVVISSGYEGMDVDNGTVVYYSAPNSHANLDPNNAVITNQTKALQKCREIGRSVRLFRTAGGTWRHVPSRGIRYDGLYSVVQERIEHKGDGGAYLRFTLIRDTNQPAMDFSRPTREEKKVFDQLMISN